MFDLDKWKEIWATLKSNPLRTMLTAFGVFWGVVMLMAMLAFGSSMKAGMDRQVKGMATKLLFIWGQSTTEAHDGLPPGREVMFSTDDIEHLRRLPAIERAPIGLASVVRQALPSTAAGSTGVVDSASMSSSVGSPSRSRPEPRCSAGISS